jgi:hypothetical protein
MKCPTCEGEAGQFGIAIRMARMWCRHCGTTYIVDTNDSSVNSVYVPETWAENIALRAQVQDHVERIAAQSELLSKRAEKPLTGEQVLAAMGSEMIHESVAKLAPVVIEHGIAPDPVEVKNWGTFKNCSFNGSTGLSSTVAGRKTEGSGV